MRWYCKFVMKFCDFDFGFCVFFQSQMMYIWISIPDQYTKWWSVPITFESFAWINFTQVFKLNWYLVINCLFKNSLNFHYFEQKFIWIWKNTSYFVCFVSEYNHSKTYFALFPINVSDLAPDNPSVMNTNWIKMKHNASPWSCPNFKTLGYVFVLSNWGQISPLDTQTWQL